MNSEEIDLNRCTTNTGSSPVLTIIKRYVMCNIKDKVSYIVHDKITGNVD